MQRSYEKHTKELYKSEWIPFITNKTSIDKNTPPWLHWHENIEFLRCLSGSGEAISNGNGYSFDDGDIITINSGAPHCFNSSGKQALRYSYLIIDCDFLRENGIHAEKLCISPHIHDKKALELFDRAVEACSSDSEFSILKARTYVLSFVLYICEKHLVSTEEQISYSSIDEIKKAVNYIRNNYNQDITLQSAAEIAGFSVCYFSRKFKKVTGQTFITFLNTVRCENADKLLKCGVKVSDACYDCGFSDPSYFSRTFKTIIGYPPSEAHKK